MDTLSGDPSGLGLGLDIGATKTLGVLAEADGTVHARVRRETEPGAAGVVRTAVRVIEQLHREAGPPVPDTVGVGVPGLVDTARGVLRHAVNLGVDDASLPLREELGRRLGLRVLVENDVNAAALGAAALSGEADLVYLSIGTGLAAGLVLDGRLRRGVHGAAGEIGHLPVDPAGLLCRCGQRGCLETVASGRALAEAWPSSTDSPALAVFAAAASGNAEAIRVRDRFAAGLAEGVRVLGLAVDVRCLVLGGGVAQVGDPLREAVAAALREQAASSPFLASLDLAGRLRTVPPGQPVAALGAALLGHAPAVEPDPGGEEVP